MLTDLEKEILQKTIWDNPYIPKDHMPFPKQIDALLDFRKELLFGGSAGGGKGNILSSKIVTPFGQKTLENITIGESISNPDGSIQKVIHIYELGEQDTYEVSFMDGAKTTVTLDHIWLVNLSGKKLKAARKQIDQESGEFEETTTKTILMTTEQLINHLNKCKIDELSGKRPNWPLIPLTTPVQFTFNENRWGNKWPIDPYILGLLIGDGSIHQGISIYTNDSEITNSVIDWTKSYGISYNLDINPDKNGHSIVFSKCSKLHETLDHLKLSNTYAHNKFIPSNYKLAPLYIRWAIIQGCFDTDGYVDSRGHCSYTTISKQLAEDVQWILRSLGFKSTVTSKIPTYTHNNEKKQGQLAYTVNAIGNNTKNLFRLTRKRDRCKDGINGGDIAKRRIVDIKKVGREPCRCIKVDNPNGLYLVDDFIVTHNSDYLLMAALQFVEQPNYNAIIFRRTYSDLSLPEGLIPRSHEWLTHTPAQYKQDLHQWKFPSGSTLTFGYLESESHIYRYKSSSFSFIGFEELTEFPIERFYTYLFSRMRKSTDSKIPLRMRATTNPDGPGAEWVYERFKPDDPQPLENGRRFLSSKLYDNPHIDQESYIANLEETDPVTRMQLQEGVWRVKKSGNKFKQEWFDRCYINEEDVPEEGITVRYWDLAATELKPGTRTNNDPDYTVGAKIRLYHNIYYIMDIRRDRLSPGKLEEYIQETAEFDGPDTIIYLEQEPGSSGKIMTDDYIRRVLSGYAAFSDRPTGPKEARANVFSAALYNGMVRLVRAPWNKPFVTECCLFPTKGVHDDQCLIKGTKVATIFGNKNIEDIKIGDILLTPGGTSKVTWSGQTGDNFVITNKGLTGTFGHNVFDRGNGFIPLLTHDVSSRIDTICVVNQIRWIARKLWYSMEYCTDSWERKDITLASQLPMQEEKVLKDCMLPFMSFIQTKRYQKAMLYIIKMVTLSTTQLIILSAWKSGNIANFINQKIQKNKLNILQKLGQKLLNGTNQKKDMLGIKNTQKVPSTTKKGLKEHVWYVVKNLNHLLVLPNIVQKNVQDQHVGNEKRQMDTMKNAEKNENLGKQPVYNLTTEPSHTFYANNVLVSNCDAVSSAIGRLPRAKRWKNGNIGEITTFNPMAQDMAFDTGDLKIEDDGIEEFF